jgi:hypothetical protein
MGALELSRFPSSLVMPGTGIYATNHKERQAQECKDLIPVVLPLPTSY